MKANKLHILYEDSFIIVCAKPHGVPTQTRQAGTPDMESLIKTHLYENQPKSGQPYLAVIHRLDQPVAGILIFAKTPAAARELNRQLTCGEFRKMYLVITDGKLPDTEGTLKNYLVKDGRSNTSRVCQKDKSGAKLALLHYRVISDGDRVISNRDTDISIWDGVFLKIPRPLTEVRLETGRHHQIRVQLAHAGCPIAGDTKYNPGARAEGAPQALQLYAFKLAFRHPRTREQLLFELPKEFYKL